MLSLLALSDNILRKTVLSDNILSKIGFCFSQNIVT